MGLEKSMNGANFLDSSCISLGASGANPVEFTRVFLEEKTICLVTKHKQGVNNVHFCIHGLYKAV